MANVTDFSQLWKIHGALAKLRSETGFILGATDVVVGYGLDPFDVTGGEAGRGADDGGFKQLSKKTDELAEDARLGMEVREGTLSADKWLAIAQTTWDGFVGLQKSAKANAFRFADVWGEVIVPTAVQTYQKAADTVEAAESNFIPMLVLLVVALIAIAVIKVT